MAGFLAMFAAGAALGWLLGVVRRDCSINEYWLREWRMKLKEGNGNG
jgi:hypothetical protein